MIPTVNTIGILIITWICQLEIIYIYMTKSLARESKTRKKTSFVIAYNL